MRPEIADQRDHRRDERNVVDDRRQDRRAPQDRDRRHGRIAAGQLHQLLRRQVEHPGGVDTVHDDEQPEEEEDRDPVDFVERLGDPHRLLLALRGGAQDCAAASGPRRRTARSCRACRLSGPASTKAAMTPASTISEVRISARVDDQLARVERHDPGPRFRARPHPVAPDQVRRDSCDQQDHDDDRASGSPRNR